MVKIRLMRVGKRKQPSYRVVVADSRSPRDGRIIEAIGHYQPRQDPSVVSIDEDRAIYWLKQGAQPSDQVRQLLRITGAWSTFTGEPPLAGTASTVPDTAPAKAAKAAKATPASSVKATPAASISEERDEGLESDTPSIESTPTEDEQLSETGGASGGGENADGEKSE